MDSETKEYLLNRQKNSKVDLLQDFDCAHSYSMRNAKERVFYEEFIDHPERFQPKEKAYLNIFSHVYEEVGARYGFSEETRLKDMENKLDTGKLRNVFVDVSYSNRQGTVLTINAEYKGGDGTYQDASDNRTNPTISDYVERIPEPQPSVWQKMKNAFS